MHLCAEFFTELNIIPDGDCDPLPIPEAFITKLNGGACFANLKLAETHFQVEVTPEVAIT